MELIENPCWKQSKYGIIGKFKTTGYSEIYRAFDRETKEQLIIKHCLEVDDFEREVAISDTIFLHGNNNHIVPIIDSFPEENYLVMPYLEGGDLWNAIKRNNGLAAEQCFAVTAQVGLALQQIHAAGVVHNDIKPGNILLADIYTKSSFIWKADNTPIVKLIDFGLSFGGPSEPNWGAGTLEYRPPEKMSCSGQPTSAVDIYSLGLTVHQMLTDTLLYWESNTPRYEVVPPHERIPENILQVIRTACELDPANRYKTAAAMVSDLEKAVYGC